MFIFAQILGFIAFIVSLYAYQRVKKEIYSYVWLYQI